MSLEQLEDLFHQAIALATLENLFTLILVVSLCLLIRVVIDNIKKAPPD